MKYVARKQIKGVFIDLEEIMSRGLWFSGYEGKGEYKEWHDDQLFKSFFIKMAKEKVNLKNGIKMVI